MVVLLETDLFLGPDVEELYLFVLGARSQQIRSLWIPIKAADSQSVGLLLAFDLFFDQVDDPEISVMETNGQLVFEDLIEFDGGGLVLQPFLVLHALQEGDLVGLSVEEEAGGGENGDEEV